MKKRACILFLIPYPLGIVASQRFRFEQYLDFLQESGFTVIIKSFFTEGQYRKFTGVAFIVKVWLLGISMAKRLLLLPQTIKANYIFIHREAAPLGPPIIEWFLTSILRKKIIYDFDDAIWLTDDFHESRIASFLRWRSKVAFICARSYRVSCGNTYLAAYAKKFNNKVIVNPTTIDTLYHHNPARYTVNKDDSYITIGWTGSHSTLKYLQQLEPTLQQLVNRHSKLRILVIADRKPTWQTAHLEFLPWTKQTEAADLLRIDIGVMPLPDDEWSRGKCGFKALQYMAMEIPCVASPVGVNKEIIEHGITGFLAESEQQWIDAIEKLIINPSFCRAMGKAGRQRVIENYSVASNKLNFLSLFA